MLRNCDPGQTIPLIQTGQSSQLVRFAPGQREIIDANIAKLHPFAPVLFSCTTCYPFPFVMIVFSFCKYNFDSLDVLVSFVCETTMVSQIHSS